MKGNSPTNVLVVLANIHTCVFTKTRVINVNSGMVCACVCLRLHMYVLTAPQPRRNTHTNPIIVHTSTQTTTITFHRPSLRRPGSGQLNHTIMTSQQTT